MGLGPRIVPLRLAAKLAAVRSKLGYTQTEMAELLSDKRIVLSKQDISKFEKGEREPTILTLLRYARLAKINMEKLADDDLELPR